MGRLDSLFEGRVSELTQDSDLLPANGVRVAQSGACSSLLEVVARQAPPLENQGVAELSDISEDVCGYMVDGKGSVVSRENAWADWVSLPGGEIGAFEVISAHGREGDL